MRSFILGLVIMGVASAAVGQTLQQRIDDMRRRQATSADDPAAVERRLRRETIAKVNAPLERVQLDVSLRDAIEWWSAAARVSVVVNWQAMEYEGIYAETPVEVDLTSPSAGQALTLICRAAMPDVRFIWDVEPGYVQLMTQAQANRLPVLAVYDVTDLMMEVPNFTEVPEFDLGRVLEGAASGGGGGQLLRDTQRDDETRLTRRERGEQLAQLIRDTIEPTIWDENGGTWGHSVRYWNGRLIVRAPKYVQRQIGRPVIVRTTTLRAGGG